MKNSDKINSKIVKEIDDYIVALGKNNVTFDKMFLFGSYAKGNAHPDSDLDIAVISKNFCQDEIEAMIVLKKIATKVSDRIEPVAITPEMFSSKYEPLIGEIHKYGIQLQ